MNKLATDNISIWAERLDRATEVLRRPDLRSDASIRDTALGIIEAVVAEMRIASDESKRDTWPMGPRGDKD